MGGLTLPDDRDSESTGGSGSTRPLNLRNLRRKTKNMHDPEIVIPFGTYQGLPSSLAYPFFARAAIHECANHDSPGFLEVGEYEDEPDTLTLRPCLAANDSTITCRWDLKRAPLSIDMLPIVLVRDILIPAQTNVAIPVSQKVLKNGAHVILLHLGKLAYRLVETAKG
jgi:hypothetical protein